MPPVFCSTKLWFGIGAFALVQAGGAPPAMADMTPVPGPLLSGQGGEGGEGGVSASRTAADPAAYLAALDVMAAHYLAGRAIYAAGQPEAAAEMFAQPISEIYVDLEPVLQARGVAPFQAAMQAASDLALQRAPKAQVDAAVDAVMAALSAAEANAPAPGPTLAAQAQALADLVDRAALQTLAVARDPELSAPYLDGYGLTMAAQARAASVLEGLERSGRHDVAERARTALQALARAYPGPERRPGAAAVDGAALLAGSSRLRLLVGALAS